MNVLHDVKLRKLSEGFEKFYYADGRKFVIIEKDKIKVYTTAKEVNDNMKKDVKK